MKTIVCHGDSLTEGADLNPNYTWPLLVENQVKVKIINSGIGPVAGSKRTCAPSKDGRNHARPCRKRKNPLALD